MIHSNDNTIFLHKNTYNIRDDGAHKQSTPVPPCTVQNTKIERTQKLPVAQRWGDFDFSPNQNRLNAPNNGDKILKHDKLNFVFVLSLHFK